jgi:anti-sigma regulatory factor (Ser/Thr protein kinase)
LSPDHDPEKITEVYNDLGPVPVDAAALDFDADALGDVRSFAMAEAARRGLGGSRLLDLELAVNELAANSIVHGGGGGIVRVWSRPGYVVCEVSDSGRPRGPRAGRRRVGPDVHGGRGLLLVDQIADLVRMSRTPAGTRVQAHFAVG